MKKTRIRIVLIVVIILMCLCCDGLLIVHYNYKEQKLYSMETPMDIANEYMQSKYDGYWKSLEGVFSARKDSGKGTYEVGRVSENIGSSYFSRLLIERSGTVNCSTKIDGTNVKISASYPLGLENVGVYVQVYDGDKGYWEGRDFIFKYQDGEYTPFERIGVEHIPNKSGLEEVTGMTIEEIVEIAEKQQEECESMLYEMKEAEMKRNKVVLFLGLGLINGIGVWLIIWKGSKEKAGEGFDERE